MSTTGQKETAEMLGGFGAASEEPTEQTAGKSDSRTAGWIRKGKAFAEVTGTVLIYGINGSAAILYAGLIAQLLWELNHV